MDIDIDINDRSLVENIFKDRITFASRIEYGELKKHNVGVYFQAIPKDKITNLSAIPYEAKNDSKSAEELGFLKIDMIPLNILKDIPSKAEIRRLLKIEPDWSLLNNRKVVEQLFQIHKHFDIVSKVKPKTIIELADTLALIRPSKRKLLPEYLKTPELIRNTRLYKREEGDTIIFKKAHSVAYALTIVLNLHLIKNNYLK